MLCATGSLVNALILHLDLLQPWDQLGLPLLLRFKHARSLLADLLIASSGGVTDVPGNLGHCATNLRFFFTIYFLLSKGEGHEGDVSEDRESKIFPESTSRNDVISCSALTPDFLIFGTDMGALHFFYLEDWTIVHEYR